MLCEILHCLFYMLIEFCTVFGVLEENFAYYSANRPYEASQFFNRFGYEKV